MPDLNEFTLRFTSTDAEYEHLKSIMVHHSGTAYCCEIMLPESYRDLYFRGKAYIKSMTARWVQDMPTELVGIYNRYYYPVQLSYTRPEIELTLIKEIRE